MDVTVGYCHTGSLCQPFVESMLNLSYYDIRHENHIKAIIGVGGAYIPDTRTKVVKEFLTIGSQWLVFFDHDMVIPPDFVSQMIKIADTNPDKRIIAALYFNYLDDKRLWSTWMIPQPHKPFVSVSEFRSDHLMKLSACGMGGTLIHRSVFERVRDGNKDDPWPWYGHDIIEVDKDRFDRVGEDLTFCHRATKAGFGIWGWTGITLGHVKSHIIDVNTMKDQPGVKEVQIVKASKIESP